MMRKGLHRRQNVMLKNSHEIIPFANRSPHLILGLYDLKFQASPLDLNLFALAGGYSTRLSILHYTIPLLEFSSQKLMKLVTDQSQMNSMLQ